MTAPIRFWQAPPLSDLPWLAHGITERIGGASHAPFAALNLGLHVGDDANLVIENRRRAAAALGFSLDRLVCAEQVHGGEVAVVDATDAGRGATEHANALPGADALVTNVPGLLLALCFADCVPVLLADPENRAIAVAHAGWRGLVTDVLPNTISAMERAFGTRRETLRAAVGPAVGGCCYEVRDELAARFPAEVVQRRSPDERPRLDLAGAAAGQLRAAGLADANITHSGHCTSCLPDRYFSHRRDAGRSGRIAALIGIHAAE